MESAVILQKQLYRQAETNAVDVGISRERPVSRAPVECLSAPVGVDLFQQPRQGKEELRLLQDASMSDIWELVKNDSW